MACGNGNGDGNNGKENKILRYIYKCSRKYKEKGGEGNEKEKGETRKGVNKKKSKSNADKKSKSSADKKPTLSPL